MFDKVLVAVDGSESSRGAIELAKNLLINGNTKAITLVSVAALAPVPLEALEFVVSEPERLEIVAKTVLEKAAAGFEKDGFKVDTVVLSGDPGASIAQYAYDNRFNLIVMGSRGLSGVKGMVLGSVSHNVLHTAHCPVLIHRD